MGGILDARIRREDEHAFQIFDVGLDASGRPAVRPVDEDVARVTLVELIPLLLRVDIEVGPAVVRARDVE